MLKVAGYNSIQILVRIGLGSAMSYILAVFAGATGLGVLGNLRNFMQGVQTFSVLGLENGLVRHAASLKKEPQQLRKIYSTAWIAGIAISVILGITTFFLASVLDNYLIGLETSYAYVFKYLAISLPFYTLFIFIASMMQGFEWYKRFISLNIAVNVLVFAVSAWLIYTNQLSGALTGIVIAPIIQCVTAIVIWYYHRKDLPLFPSITGSFDKNSLKPLLSYSFMALASAVLIPVVHILVRQDLRAVVNDDAAGLWEAIQRVSSYYMLFFTTLISMYVLPKFSKSSDASNLKMVSLDFYKTLLLPLAAGLVTIFITRDLIVSILFTEEFEGMLVLFKWQLIGDFIKIITTVLAMWFIAQNDLKRYLIAEVVSLGTFLIASYVLVRKYDTEGIVMAHAISYLLYFAVLAVLLRKELFKQD
ncbi:O-antigen translocase [Nonlabens ponticola]|uniref:O-antigen translocase n=1 Tax=Nonlabens ponticola TaxID=2496866 RepID=A0A3S9N1N0_9FLAO|nr:O-antigen translocase [Nonlabens ponticola]